MQSSSQPRHPSQILQDIRSEYEKRNNLTTESAQKHLSKMCRWKESTWGNLERSTLVSGQEWKDEYTLDMVWGNVIKENGRYYKELTAWERFRDAAAEQSAREEYLQQQAREQQAGEQESDPTPGEPPTEAVMAVKEDKNVVNGDNNGGGRGQDKRKWYWIAGLGGCAVLLLLCALGVTTAYLYVQREQLARQTPAPPVVIEKEVTRIVERTRIVEATVVVEKTQTVEITRQPEIATITETPDSQKEFFDCLKPEHIQEMIDNTRTVIELINVMDEEYYASRGGEWKGERITIPAQSVFWCDLRTSDLPAGVKVIRAQGGWGVFLTDKELTISSPNQGGRWQRLCP